MYNVEGGNVRYYVQEELDYEYTYHNVDKNTVKEFKENKGFKHNTHNLDFVYFDIETYDTSNTAGFWYGGIKQSGDSEVSVTDDFEQFFELLTVGYNRKNTKKILVAHNGIKFDMMNIVAQYNHNATIKRLQGKDVEYIDINPRVKGKTWSLYVDETMAELYLDNTTQPLFIYDSRSLLQGKLASFGETLGFPKGDTPLVDKPEELTDEYIEYVEKDVLILERAFKKLAAGNGEQHLANGYFTVSSVTQGEFKDTYYSKIGKNNRPSALKRKYGLSEKVKDDKQVKALPPLVKAQVERDIAMVINDHKNRSNNKFGVEQTVLDQVKKIAIKFYLTDKSKWYEDTPETLIEQYTTIVDKSQQSKLTKNVNHSIRSAMRGGISYVNPTKVGKTIGKGVVLDINSMYPAILLAYPLGHEVIAVSDEVCPDLGLHYVVEIKRLKAKVKEGKVPFLKGNTSVVAKDLAYQEEIDWIGEVNKDGYYTRTLSAREFEYMSEVYDIEELETGRVFYFGENEDFTQSVREHIRKWEEVKRNSEKGTSEYSTAKLMLNTLWGRWAMYDKKVKTLGDRVDIGDKETNLISGIEVTEIGRIFLNKVINKIGVKSFVYCDTDSVHIEYTDELPNLESVLERLGDIIHENTFGKWSVDAEFDRAKYIKSKTYGHEVDGQLHLTTAGSTIDPGSIKSVDEFDFGVKFKTLENRINPVTGAMNLIEVEKVLGGSL